jgi:hypothetical protein
MLFSSLELLELFVELLEFPELEFPELDQAEYILEDEDLPEDDIPSGAKSLSLHPKINMPAKSKNQNCCIVPFNSIFSNLRTIPLY